MGKDKLFSKDKNFGQADHKHHNHEHDYWSRRSFIQALGLVGGGSIMMGNQAVSAAQATPLTVALSESQNDNILVIIRLNGGNDGLNTIVPVYDYATYANLRPNIRHFEPNLLPLNDDFSIPDYMNDLESVWGDGQMKVVHGVGYPDQNLSHFRSSDIWASAAHQYEEPTGWWGRYFEDLYPDYLTNPPAAPPAIQVGNIGNLIFDGFDNNYAFTVANIEQLQAIGTNGAIHDVVNVPNCIYGDKLTYLRATANTTYTYSGVINEAYMASSNNANYGNGDLAVQLAAVARLIKGGLGTKVYMVSLGSFDTHADQRYQHQALLQDLSSSIKAFYEDLGSGGWDQKVLSMTISEFGRRPYENGSSGTDHGAASPMMLFGPALNGSGFVGDHPDLLTWDDYDNLIPSSDFRDVYASVLANWFCLDQEIIDSILLNHSYQPLDLGLDCQTLSVGDPKPFLRFTHRPVYQNNQTLIVIETQQTAHGRITLYDLMGRELVTLADRMFFPGQHSIDVRQSAGIRLSYGQYIYRISFAGQQYSKSIMVR
ncbi:DUF1501 domain-containing protein [Flavobacteriaceae bacterium]|jgi:uncharacterized protein (DUF1501 family)|nr:DUF1501 domain-containing protein [Flavobacteriaceae bacterium]